MVSIPKFTMGKSAAKIRRNQARAASRGEIYTPPLSKNNKEQNDLKRDSSNDENDEVIQIKSAAAQKLERALAELEVNPDNLNSKDRRSAKRKAEAIATAEAGCPISELLEWYERHKKLPATKTTRKKNTKTKEEEAATGKLSEEDQSKLNSAKKLRDSLKKLEEDESLNAKERRSAKRKAEAIAAEETGCPANDLLEWYENMSPPSNSSSQKDQKSKNRTPYIVFVGQLSYTTTSDMLFNHFQSKLGTDVISKGSVKIRLLTDPKTKKSRGMAFLEVESPEAMYECLKLHLTHLDGRRINGRSTLIF